MKTLAPEVKSQWLIGLSDSFAITNNNNNNNICRAPYVTLINGSTCNAVGSDADC